MIRGSFAERNLQLKNFGPLYIDIDMFRAAPNVVVVTGTTISHVTHVDESEWVMSHM